MKIYNMKYNQYYVDYLQAVEDGTIPFVEETGEIPSYLDRPASYAEYKRRNNLDDKISVFDFTEEDFEGVVDKVTDEGVIEEEQSEIISTFEAQDNYPLIHF